MPAPDPAMKPLTAPVQTSAPFLTRLRQGWEWIVASKPADAFFGPGSPLPATAPTDAAGRQRDFGMLENIQVTPRQGEPVSMDDLLYLADNHDLTRLAIDTRKDQLTKTPWSIRNKSKEEGKSKGDIDEDLMKFFRFPDGIHSYSQWCSMIWEDMLVLDAATVFVRRNAGGEVCALEPIDGATITPKITAWGRTPTEGTAFTQEIKGLPAIRYGVNDLIYFPRRPRNRHAYGHSPVEQIVVTINIALRRQDYLLQYYQAGSTPDLIISAPESMSGSADNLRKFRTWLNDLLSGNSKERRKALVVAAGTTFHDTKEQALKDECDEWLARIVCYAFSLAPTPFVKQMNRGTANTAQQSALQEGLEPFKIWHKEFIEQCLLRMGRDDVELCFEQELPIDPLQRAQIFSLSLGANTPWMQVDEIRQIEGRDPMPKPDPATLPPGHSGSLPVPGTEPPNPAPQVQDAKPTEKMAKARLSRRDRPEMLKQETKVTLGVSKRLHALSKDLVPRLVEAYGALGKADDDSKKITEAVSGEDFAALGGYLQDQGVDTYSKGVLAAAKQLQDHANDLMVNLANDRARDWALNRAGDLIKDFADATKEDLQLTVDDALREGWSNEKLASELSDAWSFSSQRAEVIARTETAFADVAGNVALYKEAGVTEATWIAADANPCDDCDDLDGTSVPVDGDRMPPLHPNCRCDIVPQLPEDKE